MSQITFLSPKESGQRRALFPGKVELQYFFTESNSNCVSLVCHETVSVYKDYNVKRHYKTKHASTFDKLSEADRAEVEKQLEHSVVTKQLYFKQAHESNKSITKASLEVALFIAKHCRPFPEDEFVKKCVIKTAEHICP